MSDVPPMERYAVISPCLRYRYELRRVWDWGTPLLVVCMLNPSKADAQRDDPTILTLIHFAKLWGYGGIRVVNLFAFRASSPAMLAAADAPVGPDNHHYIELAFHYAAVSGGRFLAAWGSCDKMLGRGQPYEGRDAHIVGRAHAAHGLEIICLGRTRFIGFGGGHPIHPMARGKHRIPRDQQPIIWRKRPPA